MTTSPDAHSARFGPAGRWIDHWEPENSAFWERVGSRIANRNLWYSIVSEHIGFSIWSIWSVLVLFMGPEYGIDAGGKFILVGVPTLVGSLLRLPYSFAVAHFGGRNWTIISAALLLIPTIFAASIMHPGTSFSTFLVAAAVAGVGGGNFASSMTNINTFFPDARKGWALGLNAGGGNIGVPVIQLVGLLIIATAGAGAPRILDQPVPDPGAMSTTASRRLCRTPTTTSWPTCSATARTRWCRGSRAARSRRRA